MTRRPELPDALRLPVTDLESGKAWVRALHEAGLMFHFEDDPGEIVENVSGRPTFRRRDLPLIRERVGQLYAQTWGPDPRNNCPIGYALELLAADEAKES